jgi:hypothetical protein
MFNGHAKRLIFCQHLFLPDKLIKILWPHTIRQWGLAIIGRLLNREEIFLGL